MKNYLENKVAMVRFGKNNTQKYAYFLSDIEVDVMDTVVATTFQGAGIVTIVEIIDREDYKGEYTEKTSGRILLSLTDKIEAFSKAKRDYDMRAIEFEMEQRREYINQMRIERDYAREDEKYRELFIAKYGEKALTED